MFFNYQSNRAVSSGHGVAPRLSFFGKPAAGVKVSEDSALTYSAYWACIKIISETIGYLPWHVYQNGVKGLHDSAHSLDDVLYRAPNLELNSFIYKELIISHALSWGNSCSEIERSRYGEVVNLWPIDPSKVEPDRDSAGRLVYPVVGGPTLEAKDVFHVRGPSRDGINGYSVAGMAKQSIGLGLATEAFGASFFGNGAIPGLVIHDDGQAKLGEDGVKNLLKSWNKKHKGPLGRGKTEYLDKGLSVEAIGIPPGDSQFLETRTFQLLEMCRWFRVPPHKLAELARSTHTNIESQNIEFVTDAIMPWVSRCEREADFRLLGREGAKKYYTKMNVMGLLRGDSKARGEFYRLLYNLGVISIDEIRDYEDMDLIGGSVGGLRLVPVNMTTAERMSSGNVSNPNKSGTVASLFEEIAGRFCKIELKRIEKFSASTSDDQIVAFYVEHARSMSNGFYRAACVLCDVISVDAANLESHLNQFFGDFCADSADQIKGAIKAEKMPAVISAWEASRAHKMSRDLITRLTEVTK